MFGEVKIVLRNEPDALIIPLAAVLEREGRRVVFIEENGLAVEIEPVFNIKEEDKISVKEGLAPGQHVIVIGQQNVSNGDKVIVTEEVE
jgi:membrane fusion protein (multidrug efflux system)